MPDAPQSGLPPFPWPQAPTGGRWENCAPGGDTCVGSPGTPWVFKSSELRNRLLALGVGSSAIETALQLLGYANSLLSHWRAGTCTGELDDPNEPDPRLLWVAPDLEVGMSVSTYRVAIHAAYGNFDDLEHVFHLRPKGGVTPDTTAAGCAALAARVAASWGAFWNSNIGAINGPVKTLFSPSLAYDKIVTSYVTYEGGSPPPKPTVITPSVTWNWPTPLAGTAPLTSGERPLPNEVACCLSLLTDTSGPRTRGRVYLGGLTSVWMDPGTTGATAGFFNTVISRNVATFFGSAFIAGIVADATCQGEVNVVSRVGGSARGVGGVRVGAVPDSQRRRRFNQPENKYLVWGTAS